MVVREDGIGASTRNARDDLRLSVPSIATSRLSPAASKARTVDSDSWVSEVENKNERIESPAPGEVRRTLRDSSELLNISSPFCPVCGVTAGCQMHGHEFPREDDVPLDLRRHLLDAATRTGVSYYWLCAIYRKGVADSAQKIDVLKDYAEDLRSVTWLAPVSASEMNMRDRWLADELDKIADLLLSGEGRAPEEPRTEQLIPQIKKAFADAKRNIVTDGVDPIIAMYREDPRRGVARVVANTAISVGQFADIVLDNLLDAILGGLEPVDERKAE